MYMFGTDGERNSEDHLSNPALHGKLAVNAVFVCVIDIRRRVFFVLICTQYIL